MDIVNINLLPCRYKNKKRANKRTVIHVGFICISFSLIIMVVHALLAMSIQNQMKENLQLEIQRNRLNKTLINLKHNQIIYQLYANKILMNTVLNQLVPSVPVDVVITRIVSHTNQIVLYCSSGIEQLLHIIEKNAFIEVSNKGVPCGKKGCKLRLIMKRQTPCQRD